MSPKAHHKSNGFSLVEMAIVLAIVALLLAGLLPTVSSQIERARMGETRKQMDEIQQALLGYAIASGRLPCPADPAIITGNTGAGTSAGTPGACTKNPGVVPWVELGIGETDAWGRRFTYAVTNAYTSTTPAFTLSSTGNLNVLATAGGNAIASGVPAVIVSHGTNGMGAWTPQGQQIAISADPGEIENSNGTTIPDPTFVSHDFSPTFDDLVIWLSPNTLNNRMVAAGKLP